MTTLTDWYDPKVDGQPVRVGYFERDYLNGHFYDYWDGSCWLPQRGREVGCFLQYLSWRGLTEPNEEKQ